jgi:hypothetical protein
LIDITSTSGLTTIGSKASVTVSGPNSAFTNLSALTTNQGTFNLLGGQSFTTSGAFTNSGTLVLSPSSVLTASGSYTQTASATLVIQLGGTSSNPSIGSIVSTSGTVALAGHFKLAGPSSVKPAIGTAFTVLNNEGGSPISGVFVGLPEGSTFTLNGMTFTISYVGGSNGDNLVITRTA